MSTRDICYYTQNYSGPEYTNHPPVFLPLLGVVHAMTPQTLHQLFGQSQVLHTTTLQALPRVQAKGHTMFHCTN